MRYFLHFFVLMNPLLTSILPDILSAFYCMVRNPTFVGDGNHQITPSFRTGWTRRECQSLTDHKPILVPTKLPFAFQGHGISLERLIPGSCVVTRISVGTQATRKFLTWLYIIFESTSLISVSSRCFPSPSHTLRIFYQKKNTSSDRKNRT